MTIISTTVDKNPLEEVENPSSSTEGSEMKYLCAKLILVHFQGKPFSITAIQIYAPTTKAEETEVEQFYEDLQNLLELTPEKDVLFIIGD